MKSRRSTEYPCTVAPHASRLLSWRPTSRLHSQLLLHHSCLSHLICCQ